MTAIAATIRIDTHVPIPKRAGRRPQALWTQWPFWQMEVGHSFFLSALDPRAHNAGRAANDYKRAHPGTAFLTRWRDDDEVERRPGIRIWRTE